MAADQKVSNVEKLVDDLCEKLREIEGQQNSVDESQLKDSTEIETMKRVSGRWIVCCLASFEKCFGFSQLISTSNLPWPCDTVYVRPNTENRFGLLSMHSMQ